jgi:hypothetical protein
VCGGDEGECANGKGVQRLIRNIASLPLSELRLLDRRHRFPNHPG